MFLFSGKRRIILPAIRRKHDKEFTVISNKAIRNVAGVVAPTLITR